MVVPGVGLGRASAPVSEWVLIVVVFWKFLYHIRGRNLPVTVSMSRGICFVVSFIEVKTLFCLFPPPPSSSVCQWSAWTLYSIWKVHNSKCFLTNAFDKMLWQTWSFCCKKKPHYNLILSTSILMCYSHVNSIWGVLRTLCRKLKLFYMELL